MTNGFIAIKNNHLNNLADVFETFGYTDSGEDKPFTNWDAFNVYLGENVIEFANNNMALWGLWFENGWTIINDPEMVDALDDEKLLELSVKLNTEVASFLIQTTSGSFGFAVYNQNLKRRFFISDGEITDNLGDPLKEETGLNINDRIFVDDIFTLAEKLGIHLEGKNENTYIVKQLAYNDELISKLEQFKQQNKQQNDKKKPWWKIW